MEIKDRVALVRQHCGLSMRDFADRIGVSHGVIANIEREKAPMTRVVGIAICSKFHIREAWLFHGEGDMLESDDLVDQLCRQRNLNAAQRAILQAAADLSPQEAQLFAALCTRVASGLSVGEAVPLLTADDLPPYSPPDAQNEKKSG